MFQSDDPAVVVAAIQALHKVFSHLIKSQEMYLPKPVDPDNMPKGKHECQVICCQFDNDVFDQ